MLKDKLRIWSPRDGDGGIVPLLPEDVPSLKLGWNSLFRHQNLAQHLEEHPGVSFRIAGTGDYIVGDHWRHRRETGYIAEVGGRHHREVLVRAAIESFRSQGCRLVILSHQEQIDNAAIYRKAGFKPIERVLYYELRRLDGRYDVRPVEIVPHRESRFPELLQLDNSAFPWLWRNSAAEFERYLSSPNVHLYLAEDNGRLVGYFSCSLYQGWAHLDRLAVVPEAQGQGFGAAQLAAAIRLAQGRDARRLSLTTQEDNRRSRSLYEGFGFDRASGDYWIHALWLGDPVVEE